MDIWNQGKGQVKKWQVNCQSKFKHRKTKACEIVKFIEFLQKAILKIKITKLYLLGTVGPYLHALLFFPVQKPIVFLNVV